MGAKLLPAWDSDTAYVSGDRVVYNGVRFKALGAIAASSTDPVDDDGANWEAIGVDDITDAYGLWYDLKFTINDDAVAEHIWSFIQLANLELNKQLRSIAMVNTRTVTLDSESKADISDLGILDIDNVRVKGDTAYAYSLRERGKVEILAAQNRYEYEKLRQYYQDTVNYFGAEEFQNPVYYIDGQYMRVAPTYDSGTELEITFIESEPMLGSTQLEVNDDYEAINSAGQTLQEWIDAGNDADDFVQATIVITTNYFTTQCPYLLKYAALVAAEGYLYNDERINTWRQSYALNLAETKKHFADFLSAQPHTIQSYSPYAY